MISRTKPYAIDFRRYERACGRPIPLEGLGGRYGPFTVKVTDADYMYRRDGSVYGLTFSGVVLDGPQIGQFRREVVRNDATGLIHVDHKHLSVAKTGTGFGTLFADALENYCPPFWV
ncbi:hypothetical protein [Nocardia brasiliensis]